MGLPKGGGAQNLEIGGDSTNEPGEQPLCHWTRKGQECYGMTNGQCKKRHEIVEADNLGTGVMGAVATSSRALDVTVLDDRSGFNTQGFLQGTRVIAAFDSADGALGKGAVLVDSGANEVVRPLQKRWHDEIL